MKRNGITIQTYMPDMGIDGTQAGMLAEFTGKDGRKDKLIELADKAKQPPDNQEQLL